MDMTQSSELLTIPLHGPSITSLSSWLSSLRPLTSYFTDRFGQQPTANPGHISDRSSCPGTLGGRYDTELRKDEVPSSLSKSSRSHSPSEFLNPHDSPLPSTGSSLLPSNSIIESTKRSFDYRAGLAFITGHPISGNKASSQIDTLCCELSGWTSTNVYSVVGWITNWMSRYVRRSRRILIHDRRRRNPYICEAGRPRCARQMKQTPR